MDKSLTLSARKCIGRVLAVFIILLSILLISYNWYILDTISDNSVEYGEKVLETYLEQVENELNNIERYFVNVMSNDISFKQLTYAETFREAHVALGEVNTMVKMIYQSALHMAGHIVYHIDTDQVREYYNYSYSYEIQIQIKKFLRENFAGSVMPSQAGWLPYQIGEQCYLVHFFFQKDAVLLAIYDLNMIYVPQVQGEDTQDSFLFWADGNNQPLTSSWRLTEAGLELGSGIQGNHITLGARNRYLIVEKELSDLGIYGVYVEPYYGWVLTNKMPIFFMLYSVFVVSLLAGCLVVIRKFFIVPLQDMVNIMKMIKEGDIRLRMEKDYRIAEFSEVTKMFNSMLDEIEKLKIADYEKELKVQEFNMRYLQIQIRPHFVLNCLKNVFGLAQEEKYKEIQETVIVLSQYLRSVLKEDIMLIPLAEELKNVENYIYLQQMLSESIRCEYFVEESTLLCRIPPLSILTFVENSVKHGKVIGKELVLTIKVKSLAGFLSIMILDNGKGFSQDELEYLNHRKNLSHGNRHIGIQNVLHRFNIIYQEKSGIAFSNAGGACIKIFIPMDIDNTTDGFGEHRKNEGVQI